jgi:hypothetical protein
MQDRGIVKSTDIISGWSWKKNGINTGVEETPGERYIVCVSALFICMIADMHGVEYVHKGVRT